jgi:F-type H+-transporting ATPase subunit alpha
VPNYCAKLNRGDRLNELLKQDQFVPMPPEEQVATLYAGVRGHLDKMPTNRIKEFETEYLKHMRSSHSSLLATIRKEGALSPASDAALKDALTAFLSTF